MVERRKKIGIVTLYDNINFGNKLQNYAVQRYYEQMGFDCWTLKLPVMSFANRTLRLFVHRLLQALRIESKSNLPTYKRLKQDDLRRKRIGCFTAEYINEGETLSGKGFPNGISEKYDYFSVGSDQVWNIPKGHLQDENYYSVFFLSFAKRWQRIAFAPSIARSFLPSEGKELFCNGLLSFPLLSCREDEGARLIENVTGQSVTVLLDPTMLVNETEWKSISRLPDLYNQKKYGNGYILVYSLGGLPEETKHGIDAFSRIHDWPIVDICNPGNEFYCTTRPDEFIWWVQHASFVLTDSFHACVFSILFRRDFAVFNRVDGENMASRLSSLLSKFGLDNRRWGLVNEGDMLDTDYTHVNQVLLPERKKASEYFKKCFENAQIQKTRLGRNNVDDMPRI